MRTTKLAALLVVGALVLAACASGDSTVEVSEPTTQATDVTATTLAAAPSTVATAVSMTSLGSVTTMPVATPSTVIETAGPVSPFALAANWAAPTAASGGAGGSGCAPGADVLPDGTWFGFAVEVRVDVMQFDLACIFFGEVAWDEAAKVGEEANNDFFIRNESERLRTVAIEPATATHWIDWTGDLDLIVGTYDTWPAIVGPAGGPCPEWCPVWLLVSDGVVTDIVEQYIP